MLAVALWLIACQDINEPIQPPPPNSFVPRPTILAGGGTTAIPTLGGPYNSVLAINEAGQVVGHSYSATGIHAYRWQSGVAAAIDLGTLGGSTSFATALNVSGQVVGYSDTPGGITHAFLWQNGTMVDLGGLGGGTSSAAGINATGQVAGSSYISIGGAAQQRAVWWPIGQAGGPVDLGTLGGAHSSATGINASGEVIGWSYTALVNSQIHGAVWKTGQPIRDLGTLGGTVSRATAINTAGQIAGHAYTANNAHRHAVIWQSGQTIPQDLGTLGGTDSEATAINTAGQVVGWSFTAGNAERHIFLWTPSDGMEDVGLAGWVDITGVNDNLQVVGGGQPAQIFQVQFQPKNYAPVVASLTLPASPVATGTPATVSAAFSDVNALDTHTALIDWGDGTTAPGTVIESGTGFGSLAGTHTYLEAGTYSVSVTVTDQGSLSGTRSSAAAAPPEYLVAFAQNVAPVVTSLTIPNSPVVTESSIAVSATFTDGDVADTHTALVDWGDGTTSAGIVTEPASGAGTATGAHSYAAAGVYTVSVTVTDQGSLEDTRSSADDATTAYVVAYDPSAGFVTGSGWIDSPAGAVAGSPSLSGRATFGFVSRYNKGASVPTGNTEFRFQAAGLVFTSTSYQWLVVAGAKAQFKGTGSINGETVQFMLTAIDGKASDGGGVDLFRIKITAVGGGIVYDNQMNDADTATPTTVLRGGNIVIHSK